jgi:hypothetical protein
MDLLADHGQEAFFQDLSAQSENGSQQITGWYLRRGDYAEIEGFLPGGKNKRVQVRLAAAMGWPARCSSSR